MTGGSAPGFEQALQALEQRLGHTFADRDLLVRALTHTSHVNESGARHRTHNEPLEFLGDSVLGFLVSDLLHRRDPEGPEGPKSRARAHLVSARSLARRSERLGLPAVLRLGRGEEKTGGRGKTALWADAYEAVIAALYLDGGLAVAARFVTAEFDDALDEGFAAVDHKSALQELLQGRGEATPDYVVEEVAGPSHRPRFRVACRIGGEVRAWGEGFSKKEAQQDAARQALAKLRGDA